MSKEEINRALDKASEWYADKDKLRAGLSVIPYIGGMLDILATGRASRISQQRIMQLFDGVTSQLRKVAADKVDAKYIESELFYDLLIKAMEASSKTRLENKIKHYAKIVSGAVQIQDREKYQPEMYISILQELTELEIAMLNYLYAYDDKNSPDFQELRKHPNQVAMLTAIFGNKGIVDRQIRFHLQRIASTGLLWEETSSMYGYTGGWFQQTPVLGELLKYLEHGPSSPVGEINTRHPAAD